MEKINLKIITVGSRKVPAGWHISQRAKMQRLYYIKGGTGSMNDGHGGRIPFEKGKIYIHPYSLIADYRSDPNDPIDHVYFDFLSTPPIISDTPIIYDLPSDSTAVSLIRSTEIFCFELQKKEMLHNNITMVTSPLVSDNCTYGQVFCGLLSTLLTTLSLDKRIPFSNDIVVLNALDTIGRDYMKPIAVSDLAADAGFDVHYFIRRFKRVMGMTPYAYLRSYRLIKAKELIGGGLPLTAVSSCVGYESSAALSRALKNDNRRE